jgi:hypothetical protein
MLEFPLETILVYLVSQTTKKFTIKILIFDLARDPVAPTTASGEKDRQDDDNDPEEPGPMADLDWGEYRRGNRISARCASD